MSPKETSEITLARFSLRLIRKGFHRFVLLGQMFSVIFGGSSRE